MSYFGELAALGTALCWVFTAIFFSEAGRRIGSFRVNTIRLTMAVAIYVVLLWVSTGRLFPAEMTSGQVYYLGLSGLIGLVIGDGCGFKALVMIGPRLTTLLWSTAPIMATIIAWFTLGEHLGWIDLVGILVTMAGVGWVVAERGDKSQNHFELDAEHPDRGTLIKGVVLGLLAALGQAAGLVLSKQAMVMDQGLDPLPASFVRMLASMIMLWLYAGFTRQTGSVLKAVRHGSAIAFSAGGAVMGPFLGVWLSLIAVRMIEAGIAATLNATTPILIIPAVIIYYKERVSSRAWFGAVLAVTGVLLLFFG